MRLCVQDMSRLKADVEGRLRLAETQITELANSVRQKDTEVQVGIGLHWLFTVHCISVASLGRVGADGPG